MGDAFDAPRPTGGRKPLTIETSPFAPGVTGPRIGRPLQMALGNVIRQIGLQVPLVLVTGNAGTGKTLLIEMAARACAQMGLTVRQAECADLLQTPPDQKPDTLFVDQADAVTDSILEALSTGQRQSLATTIIFVGSPACAGRFIFSDAHPVIVNLTPLSPSESQRHLLEWAKAANVPDLFSADGLDLIIHASRGQPRSLRSIAGAAFFGAACDGASQISLKHVAYALAPQVSADAIGKEEADVAIPHGCLVTKEPPPDPVVTEIYRYQRKHPERTDIAPGLHVGMSARLDRRVRMAALVAGVVIAFAIGSMTPGLLARGRTGAAVVDRAAAIGPLPTADFALPAAMSLVPAVPGADVAPASPPSSAAGDAGTVENGLTREEAAAVARGIREMENAATGVQDPVARR